MVNNKKIKNPGYLFIFTDKPDNYTELKNLPSIFYLKIKKKSENKNLKIYTGKKSGDSLLFEGLINKFNGHDNKHTLRSYAEFDSDKLICQSDMLGVQTHYYYHSNNTTIISNNILLIAYLIKDDYSFQSVAEALMFKKPRRSNTWFKNIKCLRAGDILTFDIQENKLKISNNNDLYNFLFNAVTDNKDYIDYFIDYFDRFRKSGIEDNIGLSLSAGSDSRTVLSGLMYTGKEFSTYSWGGSEYLETFKIKKIVNKLSLKNKIIDYKDLADNYDSYLREGIFLTSGLLTAVHQYYYYSRLPENINLFEGYLGSEFVKGELSDGMFTEIYSDIVKNNLTLKEAFNKHFPDLEDDIKNNITEYLSDTFTDSFKDINTDAGKSKFQEYLVEFIPSRVFGGLINHGTALGINYYLPFFSPVNIANIFNAGYGIKKNISLRNDFPGSLNIIEVQSKIVKKLNPDIYMSLLDRNVKFSEYRYPLFLLKNLRKYRNFKDKQRIKKLPVTEQVDYKNIRKNSKYNTVLSNDFLKANFRIQNSENKYVKFVSAYFNIMDDILKNNFSGLFE